MISIDEARARILARTWKNPPESRPADQSVGLVLAEPAVSDIDSPPYDKAMVDGYAVLASDVRHGGVELEVVEVIVAGQVPARPVGPGTAAQIMTGAPMPPGADAVVMVERTRELVPGRVRIEADGARPGQHIMRRGAAVRCGMTVLEPGHRLRPRDVGLLCEVGCADVSVRRRPCVAVLATGSELVPPGQKPAAGQIRNSNGPMLCALARAEHGQVIDLGIARDEIAALRGAVEEGLACDLLLLSGGVSAGLLDLVPRLLEQLGAEQVFHQVHLRPGKPLWFGVRAVGERRTLVFGLPGNPVSSLVCFELFVAPALRRMLGHDEVQPASDAAQLAQDHHHRGDRPTYVPARAARGPEGGLTVTVLAWEGSADQQALTHANCLAFFPPGNRTYAAGQPVSIHWLGWRMSLQSPPTI